MARTISIDPFGYHLIVDGRRVALTDTEMRVASYLHDQRGRIVSQRELMARVWNDPSPIDTTVVRMTVASIRNKAGEDVIVTRHRLGYIWGDDDADS